MKGILKLFYNPKNEEYYFIPEEDFTCDSCKKNISRIIVFRFNWGKKESNMEKFCLNCMGKINGIKNISPIKTICGALIVNEVPKFSYPVFIRPPDLNNFTSNITPFDAAQINFRSKDGTKVKDKTKFAFREVPKIDAEKAKQLTEKRIKELDEPIIELTKGHGLIENGKVVGTRPLNKHIDKIDSILDDIKNSVPVEEKPLLEDPKTKLLEKQKGHKKKVAG